MLKSIGDLVGNRVVRKRLFFFLYYVSSNVGLESLGNKTKGTKQNFQTNTLDSVKSI